MSQMRWEITISTTSRGIRVAGDVCVVEVSMEAPPGRTLWILARLRYQTRLVNSSNAVAVLTIKWNDGRWAVRIPDNEDVGVFFCGIFQGAGFCFRRSEFR